MIETSLGLPGQAARSPSVKAETACCWEHLCARNGFNNFITWFPCNSEKTPWSSPKLNQKWFSTAGGVACLHLSILFQCLFVCYTVTQLSDSLRPHGLQHTRLPCPSLSPRVCPNSCPLNRWCHSTISSSVAPFSSCSGSYPASGSFPMNQLFESGGQSIGASASASASASVLPMNIQAWFPLGWISLQSKGLSRVFSNTTVQKHQFFGA